MEKFRAVDSYELTPTNNRKSFYGKARVVFYENGAKVLYSYNTPIIAKIGDQLINLWHGYSMTTQNHIKAFCRLNKSDVNNLEFSTMDVLNLQQQY